MKKKLLFIECVSQNAEFYADFKTDAFFYKNASKNIVGELLC